MKNLILSLLIICTGAFSQEVPEFPTNRVNDFHALKAWFSEAPHTVANFEMTRTLPSGRSLKSRGTFEFRRGQGMMWRTEKPVRNAMVITPENLSVYNSHGKLLRQTPLNGGAATRFTQAFTQEISVDFLRQMERAFDITTRADRETNTIVVGLKSKYESSDLKSMLLVVKNQILEHVYYESARQGKTEVRFTNVRNAQLIPATPFNITGL